ncbi:MAG: hypothetical protein EOP11_01545, partial [Proteobacteria bacterium]
MNHRLFSPLLFAFFAIIAPGLGWAEGVVKAGAKIKAREETSTLAPGCASFYQKLSGFSVPRNLGFLPAKLREELNNVGALLRWDARVSGEKAFGYHPELKRLVEELQTERRLHVESAVALRAERRALRDQLLFAKSRGRFTPEQISAATARFKAIDQRLVDNSAELESLVRTLEPLREALGMGAISEAAHRTSRELNAVVVLHDMQPAAAGQLTHKGVGKGMRFKFNSTDEGVIAGLVPYDQNLSAKIRSQGPAAVAKKQAEVEAAIRDGLVVKRKHRVGSLVAVKKNGTTKFVDEDLAHLREEDFAWVLEEVNADLDGG